MTKRLYLKTFGCQMNERDSEIAEQLLAQDGYIACFSAEEADVILINTCSIREKAEQKVYSLLGSLRAAKSSKPALLIGVTGCVAQQEGQRIFERMPHVDLVVGTQQIYHLPEMIGRLANKSTTRELATDLDSGFIIPAFQKLLLHPPAPQVADGLKRFVTVMQGCNNYCSYCVVPGTRGREISRLADDIIEEVRILVDQGVKEITLLGQNVNSYGQTNKVADTPINFPQLLQLVAQVQGLQRLRFTTSNPKDLSAELMRCFADMEVLCPQFHLPIQSGSNAVLSRMNRKYTVERYIEQVAMLRTLRPEIALSTDIIVGFPGETDEDFRLTMDLLRTIRYHSAFSFKYSDRPHTRSIDFSEKVPDETKSRRLADLQELQDAICFDRNKEYIGSTVEVLVEGKADEKCKGRTPTNHIVHFTGNTHFIANPGDLAQVTVTHAGKHSLTGIVH